MIERSVIKSFSNRLYGKVLISQFSSSERLSFRFYEEGVSKFKSLLRMHCLELLKEERIGFLPEVIVVKSVQRSKVKNLVHLYLGLKALKITWLSMLHLPGLYLFIQNQQFLIYRYILVIWVILVISRLAVGCPMFVVIW